MDIRQIALVAQELPPLQAAFFQLLGLQEGFHDPGVAEFGLHNVLMRIGDTYLEIVSPVQAGTTAGRLLERRGGDSGYMVIVQVEDFTQHSSRLAGTDIRSVWQSPFAHARAMHLHPRDVPGAIVSLDEMTPPQAWHWAGQNWRTQAKASRAERITGAEISCADPQFVASRWSLACGIPCEERDRQLLLPFDNSSVRFVERVESAEGVERKEGSDDALTAVDLLTRDSASFLDQARSMGLNVQGGSVALGGVRFNIHND